MSDRERILRELKQRCRVPRHFADLELEDMEDDGNAGYRKQLRRIEAFAAERLDGAEFIGSKPLFVYLTGSFGAGKTRAAAWLLKRAYLGMKRHRAGLIGARSTPLFVRTNRLVEFRFPKRDEEEEAEEWNLLRDRVFSTRFLVIDDIGRIADYKGELVFLERVVEERFDEGLSTVITSNLSGEELRALGARFADFLAMFEEVTLTSRTRAARRGR
jgi:DNA replication protein DnaC